MYYHAHEAFKSDPQCLCFPSPSVEPLHLMKFLFHDHTYGTKEIIQLPELFLQLMSKWNQSDSESNGDTLCWRCHCLPGANCSWRGHRRRNGDTQSRQIIMKTWRPWSSHCVKSVSFCYPVINLNMALVTVPSPPNSSSILTLRKRMRGMWSLLVHSAVFVEHYHIPIPALIAKHTTVNIAE